MRILIIGTGRTGRNLAAKLCEMNHDIVVVDPSAERLAALEEHVDVLTVQGSGSSPTSLEKAEVQKADLLIAVSNRDEVNILACQYAHAAGVAHKVARVADPSLLRSTRLDFKSLGVDLMISHKEEAAQEMFSMLCQPGLQEKADLLDGRVVVAGIHVEPQSPLLQGPLHSLRAEELIAKIRFIAILRGDQLTIPYGDTLFTAGDDVYVALEPAHLDEFLDWACPGRRPFEKVVVAGGGDLGMELVRRLETKSMSTVLLERDPARAGICSEALNKSLVLHGNASDQDTLVDAGVGPNTAFVAVTGDEELNIITCILANKLGAGFTLAQVTKPEYEPLIKNLSLLDRVISPHLIMINAILHFVRGQHIKSATWLHKLPGELLHVVVPEGHRWAGRKVGKLRVPKNSVLATVLRDDTVHVPTGDLVINAGDQLVIFVKPETVDRVQSIFKD